MKMQKFWFVENEKDDGYRTSPKSNFMINLLKWTNDTYYMKVIQHMSCLTQIISTYTIIKNGVSTINIYFQCDELWYQTIMVLVSRVHIFRDTSEQSPPTMATYMKQVPPFMHFYSFILALIVFKHWCCQ